jgi:hypothetical protein
MLLHNMVHDRFDRAAESELACTTEDNRFWLIHVQIELLKKLSYSLRRSDGLICHGVPFWKKKNNEARFEVRIEASVS